MEPSANPERSEAVLSKRPQCLVIDGHPIVRLGVRGALGDEFEIQEVESRAEAIELVRDIGSFEVGRVLPFAKRRMVGPFIFFDHFGPVRFEPGTSDTSVTTVTPRAGETISIQAKQDLRELRRFGFELLQRDARIAIGEGVVFDFELAGTGIRLPRWMRLVRHLDPELADQRPSVEDARADGPVRVYAEAESDRLDRDCLGFLMFLEQHGVLATNAADSGEALQHALHRERLETALSDRDYQALAGDDESADEATVKRFFRERGRVNTVSQALAHFLYAIESFQDRRRQHDRLDRQQDRTEGQEHQDRRGDGETALVELGGDAAAHHLRRGQWRLAAGHDRAQRGRRGIEGPVWNV